MMRSKPPRSTTRSLITGEAAALHGSIQISSPSRNSRMWSWHAVVSERGPCGTPLIIMPQDPQIPSRQSCSKAIGSWPSSVSRSFTRSSISRNDMCSEMSSAWYRTKRPAWLGPSCRQTCRVSFILLVAPLGELHVLELEGLHVAARPLAAAAELPDGPVRVVVVVAPGLPVGGRVLGAVVRAARLVALERVVAHHLGELEEVGDAAGLLERLVERGGRARHPDLPPEPL